MLKGTMRTSPRLLLDSLKRCPLCEAVNAEASVACFVCGWAGEFERDADEIQSSFDDLVARCPQIAALKSKDRKKGALRRMRTFFSGKRLRIMRSFSETLRSGFSQRREGAKARRRCASWNGLR